MLVGALVLVAGVSVGMLLRGGSTEHPLDPNMLAVAPFDEIGSGLEGWGEGLSDVLANVLDGAGPLRTVSPSLVVSKWSGRADPTSAAQLGASLGAGLAVYGRLMVSGGDSVRLAVTLFDVASQNPIGDIEVRNHRDNIDRLADSVAVRLLGELSRVRQLGAVQLNSLGSSSPAAIKAFLQGERHYRRTALDSAEFYYQRALELDTAFALAYNRLGSVAWWSGSQAGTSSELFLQAGVLNRGLSLRESLLVTVDSIFAATFSSFVPDSTTWAMMRRLFATLEQADRSYSNDPQIQYRIGEARLHLLLYWRKRERLVESFARAVELDSTFAPAYVHLIELQVSLQDIESARQSIAAYLALEPTGAQAEGARITAAILDPAPAASAELDLLLDTASVDARRVAVQAVWALLDSAETAIRIARSIYDETSSSGNAARARRRLANALAFRGHLQEAREITGTRPGSDFDDRVLFTELALVGQIQQKAAAEVFGAWQEAGSWNGQFLPMSWWTSVGDTVSLKRAGAFFESQIESDTLSRWLHGWATWSARKANFYLALARRDTTEALQLAEQFPQYSCHSGCYYQRLTKAQLLAASGRDREAAQLLDEGSNGRFLQEVPGDVLWQLERARVYERLGDRDKAISDYMFVADVWRHADDLLQPFVAEAREALVRLTEESN